MEQQFLLGLCRMPSLRRASRSQRQQSRQQSRSRSRSRQQSRSRSRQQSQSRSRQQRKSRKSQRGGNSPSVMAQSLAQGREFLSHHVEQHGGGVALQGAPVGHTGVLDASLRGSAGILQQDDYYAAAAAQSDLAQKPQTGGRRKSRKSKGKSRKSKSKSKGKSRKSKGKSSKSRRQSGGCGLEPASTTQPGMLLTDELYSKAGLPSFRMLA
jgi:hypothetical protein